MILEITARSYHGYCGVCAKSRGFRRRISQLGWILRGLLLLPCLPFMLIYMEGLRLVRRRRFPFDRTRLLQAIQMVHSDLSTAHQYLEGVVDGYWEQAPSEQLFTRHAPQKFGREDGGRLRRAEISVTDIPTHRGRMTILTKMPGIRFLRVGGPS